MNGGISEWIKEWMICLTALRTDLMLKWLNVSMIECLEQLIFNVNSIFKIDFQCWWYVWQHLFQCKWFVWQREGLIDWLHVWMIEWLNVCNDWFSMLIQYFRESLFWNNALLMNLVSNFCVAQAKILLHRRVSS